MREPLTATVPPGPRLRRPVAVLLSRFPLVTETFILREITELERQAQPVVLVPMLREDPGVIHAEARPWIDRAIFTPFMSARIAAANARALFNAPATVLGLLGWIVRRTIHKPGFLVRSLLLFPKSVYLAELLQDEGVTHVHAHFATHPATMARIISALSGIPFSFTVHAHDIFVTRTLLREKLRAATFVRAISNFNKSYLESLYPDESGGKIDVVHVGIRPEKYQGDEHPLPETPRILCIAALKPYKGVPYLVEACRLLTEEGLRFTCEIIGSGPMESSIRRTIERHRLEDRVRLRGALPEEDVAEELRRCTLFVLPSVVASDNQMEGIPVALMEAMAAGKPVVTTAISGIPELVEDRVTGALVDPGNARTLAGAIRRIITDREAARAMAARGRERVTAGFNLPQTVGELIALLDRHTEGEETPHELLETTRLFANMRAVGLQAVHERADSTVVEVSAFGEGMSRALIVKEQRPRAGESRPPRERTAEEWAILSRLAPHFESIAEPPRTTVPAPVEIDASGTTIVMRRAAGSSLEHIIRNARSGTRASAESLRRAAFGAGVWLRRFQELESSDGTQAVERAAARVRVIAADHADDLGRDLAGRLTSRAEELQKLLLTKKPVAVPHHGDFWPGNVFSRDGAITVIDFEGYRTGLPSEDIAYFLLHAGLYYYPLRSRRPLEMISSALFEGFAREIDRDEMQLCRLAAALTMVRHAPRDSGAVHCLLRRRYLRRELAR